MYCTGCGKQIPSESQFCPGCGKPAGASAPAGYNPQPTMQQQYPTSPYQQAEGKDWLVSLLLCIFVGGFGVHRFYTGHIVIGIIQLLTGGGCGIWWIIDLIFIITGSYKDSDGRPLVRH